MDIKSLFKDENLYTKALTHRSYLNEHHINNGNNERLEFLGDAVLELLISEYLYNKFPGEEEGILTSLRANLVNTTSLAKMSESLGISDLILLSKGEEETGGRSNNSILADTFEAILGAIYLDSGIEKAKSFLEATLIPTLEDIQKKPLKDAKSRLQELVQKRGYFAPTYTVITESGLDHEKTFEVAVLINDKRVAFGTGKSKSEAEQDAAEEAISKFNNLR